jgi:hypothetical protein
LFRGLFLKLSRANIRNLEDFVTWVDSSKIKRNIMKYSNKVRIFFCKITNY